MPTSAVGEVDVDSGRAADAGVGWAGGVNVGRAMGAEAGCTTGGDGVIVEKSSEKTASAALNALNARIRLEMGDIGTAFLPDP